MGTRLVTPKFENVSELLAMIFGEGTEASDSSTPKFDGNHIATFVSDDDELVAIAACDRPFVCFSGAALSMIPKAVAAKFVDGEELTSTLQDNFYEVMNICSKLLMSDSTPHLRLASTLPPDQAGDSISKLADSATTVGFTVDIPRYGAGDLSFMLV